MKMKPCLAIEDIRLIAAGCEAEAGSLQRAVSLAIVDDGGYLLSFLRLEGAPATGAEIAPAKARLAALGRRDSVDYQDMVDGGKTSFISALELVGIRGAGLEGGVAILVDGHCIGAVGVAGASSAQDAQIARAGIAAFSLTLSRDRSA